MAFGISVVAQSSCPTISVMGPSGIVPIGENMIFTAKIGKEAENYKIEYFWTVTNGKIVDGQGTLNPKFISDDGCSGSATLQVKGLPENCPQTASVSFEMSCCPPPTRLLIDEFSENPPRIHKERLENLRVELFNDPTAKAYIVEKFKRGTSRNAIKQRISQTFFYLIQTLAIEKERISLQIFYADENLTQFWIVPAGAEPPNNEAEKIEINGEKYQRKLEETFPTSKKKSQPKTTKKP